MKIIHTRTLTLSALCFKFLCVVDLTQEIFEPYTGISKFQVTCWMDKLCKKLNLDSSSGFQHSQRALFFNFLDLIANIFNGLTGSNKHHSTLCNIQALNFSAGEAGNNRLVMCLLHKSFTLCSYCDKNSILKLLISY